MTDTLPRETFKRAHDAALEDEVARVLEQWAKATYLHIGPDDPDKRKSSIDGLLFREDTVVAFTETKGNGRWFGGHPTWTTSARKVGYARQVHAIMRVPVLMVVRFACGTIAYVDALQPYRLWKNWGRHDRGSPGDIEDGAEFDLSLMKVIRRATQ
jgi:hypothetical protein